MSDAADMMILVGQMAYQSVQDRTVACACGQQKMPRNVSASGCRLPSGAYSIHRSSTCTVYREDVWAAHVASVMLRD